jgi:hypothetical protein
VIASEAERVQIPLAAEYLREKRFLHLGTLVHQTRRDPDVLTPYAQQDVDTMVKAVAQAEATIGLASHLRNVPVPPDKSERPPQPCSEERRATQLAAHPRGDGVRKTGVVDFPQGGGCP